MHGIKIKPLHLLAFFLLLTSFMPKAFSACQVDILSMINFGNYDPSSRLDGVGEIKVGCDDADGKIDYQIQLSPGLSGNYANRTLNCVTGNCTAYPSSLQYNIYVNAGRNRIWGDGSGATELIDKKSTFCKHTTDKCKHNLYGRIPSNQQGKSAGHYQDTLIVSVDYN